MSNGKIQSVVRALNILEYISTKNGAGVSEIARELELNKSTAFGLIKTLESERYIVKDKNNDNYKIGLKLYSLSQNALNKSDFQEYVKPYLEDLSEKFGETIHLVVATENEGIYIDKIESTKSIRIHTQIGDKLPLHCTGVGKAIMAYKDKEQVDAYINDIGLKKYTDKTITDPENFVQSA
jgi:IclR family KDG regulon transcriptional repressor